MRQKAVHQFQLFRLPLWSPTALLVSGAVFGLIVSLGSETLNTAYIFLFGISAILGTLFVHPRGLVLSVSQIPLMFTVLTPIMAWLMASKSGSVSANTPTKTRLITAAYPIVQFFPWLVAILVIAIGIAVWRYLSTTRVHAKQGIQERKEAARRKKQAERTTTSATQARRRAAESDARTRRHRPAQSPEMRPASEIIRDAERRRIERAEQFAQQRRQRQQYEEWPHRSDSVSRAGSRSRYDESQSFRPSHSLAQDSNHGVSERRLWGESRPSEYRPSASLPEQPKSTSSNREWPPRYERPRMKPELRDRDDRDRHTWKYQ